MKILPISDIRISEDRQRKVFNDEAISELAESIGSTELLHPPVVREVDGGFELVCGERRLRAIQSLNLLDDSFTFEGQTIPVGHVPVTILGELSILEIQELELHENVLREALTPAEEAAAIAKLHRLRKEQNPGQTLNDTAEEISSGRSKIAQSLIIADHLQDPEVAKAKTAKDMLKIIERKANAKHREKLAEQFKTEESPHVLLEGSAFELTSKIPDSDFDMVLTDPPYGVGADSFGDQAVTAHNYEDTPELARRCYGLVALEAFRITHEAGCVYAFMDIKDFDLYAKVFEKVGWSVWPRPLIWYKRNGMLPVPDIGPRYTYEAVLFAYKPKFVIKKQGMADVLDFGLESNRLHAAQKPVDLYAELINRSVLPNAKVADFFAGSGTIFSAANRTNTKALGIELNPDNINICKTRLLKEIENETESEQLLRDLGAAPF